MVARSRFNLVVGGGSGGGTVAPAATLTELQAALASGSGASLSGKHVEADELVAVSAALGLPAPKFSATFAGLGDVLADGQLGHLTATDGAHPSGVYEGKKPATWALKMEVSTETESDGVTYVTGHHAVTLGQRLYVPEGTPENPRHTLSLPSELPHEWVPTEITAEDWAVVDFALPDSYTISYRPWGGAGRAHVYRNPAQQEFFLYLLPDASERAHFSAQGLQLGTITLQPAGLAMGVSDDGEGVGAMWGATIFNAAGRQTQCGFWIDRGPRSIQSPSGAVVPGTSVPFDVTRTSDDNVMVDQLEIVAAEAYTGRLLYRMYAAGSNVPLADLRLDVAAKAGDTITWTFSPPLLMVSGFSYRATVEKYEGSQLFKVRNGSLGIPWRTFGSTPARFAEAGLLHTGATNTQTFTTWPTEEQLRSASGVGRAGFDSFVYVGVEPGRNPGLYLNPNTGLDAGTPITQPVKI